MGLGLSDLPSFNWLVERPANDHAHVVWALAEPVHRYPEARAEPLRYFAGIAEYYAFATNADASYAGCSLTTPHAASSRPTERPGAVRHRIPWTSWLPSSPSTGRHPASGRRAWAATSIYSKPACDGLVVKRMPACRCCQRYMSPTKTSPTRCHCLRCRRRRAPLRNTASGGPRAVGIVLAGYRGKRHVGGAAAKPDTWGATSH